MKRTIKAKIILQQHFGNADGGDAGSRWYVSEPVAITFDEPSGSQLACGYEVVGADIEQDVCIFCGEPLGPSFHSQGDGTFYHFECKYPKVVKNA